MLGIFRTTIGALALAAGAGLIAQGAPAQAADMLKAKMALPTTGISWSFAYIAKDLGFWKDEGLDLDVVVLNGLAATNAMMSGSVEFTGASGTTLLTAGARGLKVEMIADLFDKLPYDIVVSKEFAKKTGLDPKTSNYLDRARALKGATIIVDAPRSIADAYLKYFVRKAGLNPERDIITTPVAPIGTVPALAAHKVDGFVLGPPWTNMAVDSGVGVYWLSTVHNDIPGLSPIIASVVLARTGYCEEHKDICTKYGAGLKRSFTYMREHPKDSIERLKKIFPTMDPESLRISFEQMLAILQKTPVASLQALENTQEFAIEAGLITTKLKSFDGLYNNAFVQ
jgi:ABC-type nitrate/sulfonate/bicarbonate transport system substrate-binding protein